MNKQEIISTLKEIGLTEYEAKIYISLLQEHPSNGNAIATSSGVPPAKVYEALRRMKKRGLVYVLSGGDNGKLVRYSPLPYKELLKGKKDTFIAKLDSLEESLSEISSQSDTDWTELYLIEGYSSSIEFIQSAISDCKSEILLSCWKKEFEFLKESLERASGCGIKIVTMIFDDGHVDVPWRNFIHYSIGRGLNRHSGELSIVIDNSKTILFYALDDCPHSIVSSHPSTISITRNYIRHDIYVNRILQDFGERMVEYYGQNLDRLINDF
ncbi:TrmB family transcriptional regulator [Peribacillus frigoritolerans]|uniref:TrmB family transcriptional regulator n=1 Tax=Peribacillus frigoritolerans TaxID=450367 RepID=UPI003F7FFE95